MRLLLDENVSWRHYLGEQGCNPKFGSYSLKRVIPNELFKVILSVKMS